MSCEGTESSKQALRQEGTGGERVSTTTYITTQGTPAEVQNEAQTIQEQGEVSGQGLGILKQHARNRIQNQHQHPGTDPPKGQNCLRGEIRIVTSQEDSALWTDASGYNE
ncbi:hypothetical protein MRX96_044774 [Rhipicephalus microplus]